MRGRTDGSGFTAVTECDGHGHTGPCTGRSACCARPPSGSSTSRRPAVFGGGGTPLHGSTGFRLPCDYPPPPPYGSRTSVFPLYPIVFSYRIIILIIIIIFTHRILPRRALGVGSSPPPIYMTLSYKSNDFGFSCFFFYTASTGAD